jgi:CRISPR/Cas system-associated exonuclease Cas4 (RecB family)
MSGWLEHEKRLRLDADQRAEELLHEVRRRLLCEGGPRRSNRRTLECAEQVVSLAACKRDLESRLLQQSIDTAAANHDTLEAQLRECLQRAAASASVDRETFELQWDGSQVSLRRADYPSTVRGLEQRSSESHESLLRRTHALEAELKTKHEQIDQMDAWACMTRKEQHESAQRASAEARHLRAQLTAQFTAYEDMQRHAQQLQLQLLSKELELSKYELNKELANLGE